MTSRSQRVLSAIGLIVLGAGVAGAGALLEPQPAPEWQVAEWLNDDPGSLRDHRGRVVLIEFFQLWCPGCHAFSLPLFERWQRRYGGRDDVLVVSIHSVFEAHELQSPELLRAFVRERGILRPVGVDASAPGGGEVPVSMERFGAEGSPHVVIVDTDGQIVFSHFGAFDPAPVESYVDRLLKKKTGKTSKARSKPRGKTLRAGERTRPPARRQPARTPRTRGTPPSRGAGDGDGPSGPYRLEFEQTDKSCGNRVQPLQLIADVEVVDATMNVRVRRPFLGLHRFSGTYDDASNEFRVSESATVKERGVDVEFSLELFGSIDLDTAPPTLRYQFALEKSGPTAEWACTIQGRGAGQRLSR